MSVIFRTAFKCYLESFSSVAGFFMLLAFSLFFLFFDWVFVSSGSIFSGFGFFSSFDGKSLVFLAGLVIFLFFYSVFTVLMVFSVRDHLSSVKLHYYLSEKIRKFALKYFAFLLVFFLAGVAVLYFFSAVLGLKAAGFLVLFLVFLFFVFLPQSIVVDEESIFSSLQNSVEFSMKSPIALLAVFLCTLAFFAVLLAFEFLLNFFFLPGEFFSLFATMVFVVPFVESMKTAYYMEKFGIVKSTSLRSI